MNRRRRFAVVMLVGVFVPTAAASAGSDWPPELHAALETYRMGDYEEAQGLCMALMAGTRDERLRREAAALHAVATMRMPARNDRLDGRARLAQLAQEDPTLAARPECRLANGIAQLALSETASAIRELDAATEGFAERQQYERLAETFAALAQAWSCHNEWEVSLEQFGVRRPRSPDEARAVRRAQIAKLRKRVATLLPDDADALARIDLVLAENLIDAGDKVDEGVDILKRLAGSASLTPAGVQACLALGQRYEQQGDWAAALQLHRRAQAAGLGAPSRRAGQRVEAISRPQLLVDVPAAIPAGQPIQLGLRVRNLDSVQFELRRVDLDDWLASCQGRFAEGRLPVSGSVVFTREIVTRADTPYQWWTAAGLAEPLTCAAGPGAYVAVAQASDADGRLLVTKKLVLVSDLHAVTLVGRRHALIWATASGQVAQALCESSSARFWMHGSFVPTQPRFAGGVARFALPAEARLLRDKRWVCLVQAGEHLALCRGTLPAAASYAEAPTVALVADSADARPGQVLRLLGLLVAPRGGAASPKAEQTLQLDVLDPQEQLRHSASAEVSPTGAFSVELPLAEDWAGEHLNVVVRCGGQVLENVRGRFGFDVQPADAPQFTVTCHLPTGLEPGVAELAGEIHALYPWGTPLADAKVHYTARAVRLPSADSRIKSVASPALSDHGRLDAQGRWVFNIPVSLLEMPPGPLAIGVWARVIGWDQRQVAGFTEVFVPPVSTSAPVHLWLSHDPPKPRAGELVRFRLAWFDPENRSSGQRPSLELRHAGVTIARPRLLPSVEGLESEPWRPNAPGNYEVLATLPMEVGEPLDVHESIEVSGSEAVTGVVTPGVKCQAQYARREQQWGIQVRLSGEAGQPLLVFAEGGDPLAAFAIPELDESAELFLAIEGRPIADARVFIATVAADGLQVLTSAAIEPAQEETLALALEPASGPVSPGAIASIDVVCTRETGAAPPAMLLARLIDAAGTGYVDWIPGPVQEGGAPEIGGLTAAFSGDLAQAVDESSAVRSAAAGDRLSPELAAALFEGTTLWAGSRLIEAGRTRLDVPIPAWPGRYRLIVLARSPSGVLATDALMLDAREGIRVLADVAETFTIGDRSVLAVALENPRSARATVGVSIQGGDGLHIEALRVVGGEAAKQTPGKQTAVTLALRPHKRVRLLAQVEAIRAGKGTAVIELEAETARQRVERGYRILAPPPVAPTGSPDERPPPIRVKRTLLLLTDGGQQAERSASERTAVNVGSEEPAMRPLAPGARLTPGQWLLIRDELTLEQRLEGVEWSQRLPAACVPPAFEQMGLISLGQRSGVRLDSVTYSAAQLPIGGRIHECPLVVVRPGTYLLPPPNINVRGQPVAVELEPAETHIVVSDSPSSNALPPP